ncbi:DDE-domain-containing protein [Hyaloscypha variabilis F]|uniref:DDE-domain-containing protein n=1 Tax=Hyaloscypha variabilis (strain UAMH 11265 / GT02V1 / F) TaxID=1149755 RepID=A0A2J6RLD1_HYAVF|nr:DDE-domain-containing protein [Hyaloscypha variabilis F]PMD39307.1 DDE-domain-containing protein [Hyaloscypha variabilis F]
MVIEKYKITAENIYNFDEKGFMIGFGRSLKRIITAAALSSGRVTKARQDGSREFISCLACISAIGRWIPPALIYKGESGHLMSTWVDDVTTESKAHFTVSHNGWSNNAIGLTWLKTIFERYTKPKRTTQKRLLIVDGHSSHVNIAFVDWADQHGIILLILPPHTTHRLQPLDVGLFQPLSTYYSVEINDLLDSSLGTVGMTKGLFWKYFKPAFDEAFTEENIQSAFRKSGIWPTDGSAIIKMITRPTLAPEVQDQELRTPKDSKAIRRFQLAYDREPTADKVKKLFATTLHLSAQVSCLQHQNEGLFKAIELQKKKGRQGVRLNLCGEPNKGIIDCYSPAKVVKAREYQEQKEALKAAEDKAKLERKIQRAANALKNKQDKERKAKAKAEKEAKAAREQMAKELAAAVKKALQEEQNSTAPKAKKAAPTVSKQPKPAPGVKAPVKLSSRRSVVVPAPSVVDVVVEARRTATRTITRPARFT